jgi:tRNA G26 N,N-dimethylase Trm1
MMHETGIRILIRKVQLIGAQHEKALLPVYSYFRHHYMRLFLRCLKGRGQVDAILAKHGMLGTAGPMWLGRLWDESLALRIHELSGDLFTGTIAEESRIDAVGFYDMHEMAGRLKLGHIPTINKAINMAGEHGKSSRTHFAGTGVRAEIDEKSFIRLLVARQ